MQLRRYFHTGVVGCNNQTNTIDDLPGEAGFYVEDDGPGIPEAERERVFESGYSNAPGGTRFGLAIVGEIAGAHGWTSRSRKEQRGATRFEIVSAERMAPSRSRRIVNNCINPDKLSDFIY
ncbi:Signal transduction histidine kinase [Halalkaliarchaeum sp. AArc-CO]|nr:Signal transduction histidine kinase [Halalkaliarchaeum sp. AArc-CO]